MVAVYHHHNQSGRRRVVMFVLTSMFMLVAAPTASARWDDVFQRGFVPIVKVRLDDPVELTPAQKLQFEAINRDIPANPQLAVAAPAFSLMAVGADPMATASALDCMTAAVYYEAGQEPITGQRAVAQVILNRVRHPAFPDTVCGVVFQGAERSTGCQFTFTCDGALRRRPVAASWLRARAVAGAALDGFVETSVGHATHYHASYVLPHWAPNLTKLTTIGSHIFYQWKGGWSRPAAFTDRYASGETMPPGARIALAGYLLAPSAGELIAPSLAAAPLTPDMASVAAQARSAGPVQVAPGIPEPRPVASGATNLNVPKSQLIERPSQLKSEAGSGLTQKAGSLDH